MKTIVILLITYFVATPVDKYTDMMTKNISAVYQASSIPDLQTAVNTFERIGNAEKSKWEPFYYAAFGYTLMATREQDKSKIDGYLDLAKAALDKAAALQPNDSEILAMEGFIHMIRVGVDPASRGQQYSMMAMQAYGKALGINPENPRALALMAQLQFGTAQFFKQAPTEACETARRASKLFEKEAAMPESLQPRWGKGMNESLAKNCQ